MIVPELKGSPIPFTKNTSKYEARFTISGIIRYITNATNAIDKRPARINPFGVTFQFFYSILCM